MREGAPQRTHATVAALLMAEDDSGFITYDELRAIVRGKLKVKKKDLSDDALKALFCALDAGTHRREARAGGLAGRPSLPLPARFAA